MGCARIVGLVTGLALAVPLLPQPAPAAPRGMGTAKPDTGRGVTTVNLRWRDPVRSWAQHITRATGIVAPRILRVEVEGRAATVWFSYDPRHPRRLRP